MKSTELPSPSGVCGDYDGWGLPNSPGTVHALRMRVRWGWAYQPGARETWAAAAAKPFEEPECKRAERKEAEHLVADVWEVVCLLELAQFRNHELFFQLCLEVVLHEIVSLSQPDWDEVRRVLGERLDVVIDLLQVDDGISPQAVCDRLRLQQARLGQLRVAFDGAQLFFELLIHIDEFEGADAQLRCGGVLGRAGDCRVSVLLCFECSLECVFAGLRPQNLRPEVLRFYGGRRVHLVIKAAHRFAVAQDFARKGLVCLTSRALRSLAASFPGASRPGLGRALVEGRFSQIEMPLCVHIERLVALALRGDIPRVLEWPAPPGHAGCTQLLEVAHSHFLQDELLFWAALAEQFSHFEYFFLDRAVEAFCERDVLRLDLDVFDAGLGRGRELRHR